MCMMFQCSSVVMPGSVQCFSVHPLCCCCVHHRFSILPQCGTVLTGGIHQGCESDPSINNCNFLQLVADGTSCDQHAHSIAFVEALFSIHQPFRLWLV